MPTNKPLSVGWNAHGLSGAEPVAPRAGVTAKDVMRHIQNHRDRITKNCLLATAKRQSCCVNCFLHMGTFDFLSGHLVRSLGDHTENNQKIFDSVVGTHYRACTQPHANLVRITVTIVNQFIAERN